MKRETCKSSQDEKLKPIDMPKAQVENAGLMRPKNNDIRLLVGTMARPESVIRAAMPIQHYTNGNQSELSSLSIS